MKGQEHSVESSFVDAAALTHIDEFVARGWLEEITIQDLHKRFGDDFVISQFVAVKEENG